MVDYSMRFEVGDDVVVCGGKWITELGEVLRVTRCYLRVSLNIGVVAMIRRDFCVLLVDGPETNDDLNVISDDSTVSTETEY
jgi:hypothetical protein